MARRKSIYLGRAGGGESRRCRLRSTAAVQEGLRRSLERLMRQPAVRQQSDSLITDSARRLIEGPWLGVYRDLPGTAVGNFLRVQL